MLYFVTEIYNDVFSDMYLKAVTGGMERYYI